MKRRDLLQSLPAAALLPAAGWLSSLDHSQDKVSSGTSSMVYELRVYHTYEGKLDDLLRRFREHTMRLFEKHGIRNEIGRASCRKRVYSTLSAVEVKTDRVKRDGWIRTTD